ADVFIGDSLLRLTVNLNTTIADDSIGFNITTASPGSYGTATLNGVALARGDSILLTMAPSEFFLNQARWEVDGGSSIVFRSDALSVSNLNLLSGLQRITVHSEANALNPALVIDAANLDLAQLGGAAGYGAYTPDGRINGTIRVTDVMATPTVSASVRASGVKIGADTLGAVVIIGAYNGAKRQVMLEPGSGVFRGAASITADGT